MLIRSQENTVIRRALAGKGLFSRLISRMASEFVLLLTLFVEVDLIASIKDPFPPL